jgi:hypothetical protein
MLHDFVIALQKQIDTRITNLSNDLAGGCAKDHTDYKRIVGGIAELKHVREMARELMNRFINDDEDEDTNG